MILALFFVLLGYFDKKGKNVKIMKLPLNIL